MRYQKRQDAANHRYPIVGHCTQARGIIAFAAAKLYQAKVRFVPRRIPVSRASAIERDRADRLLGGVISLDARMGTREEKDEVEEKMEEKEEEEVEARSHGLREGIGDAQSRVSFPSSVPSPEGTISSGTESAREPGRGDPAAIPIASLFDMRQFRPICRAP